MFIILVLTRCNFILVEFTLCNKLLLQYINQHEALQDMDDFLQSKAILLTLVSYKRTI